MRFATAAGVFGTTTASSPFLSSALTWEGSVWSGSAAIGALVSVEGFILLLLLRFALARDRQAIPGHVDVDVLLPGAGTSALKTNDSLVSFTSNAGETRPAAIVPIAARRRLVASEQPGASAPVWFLTLLGGALADRSDRRPVIAIFRSVQMLFPTAIVVLLDIARIQP